MPNSDMVRVRHMIDASKEALALSAAGAAMT